MYAQYAINCHNFTSTHLAILVDSNQNDVYRLVSHATFINGCKKRSGGLIIETEKGAEVKQTFLEFDLFQHN